MINKRGDIFMSKCDCVKCHGNSEFDANAAYREIDKKFLQLADLMAEYMSEAGLERALRAKNAFEMAARLPFIVGGLSTSNFPECCALEGSNCTGVLVHSRIVLTAAHCRNTSSVWLNSTSINDPRGENIKVLLDFPHHNYNPATHFFDIRVLILKTDAVTLPVSIATAQEFMTAAETTLVGFGQSEFGSGLKRKVTVPIDHAPTNGDLDEEREFIAGGGGYDTCDGDSGGPAYITVGGTRKVAGLTSRGIGRRCGDGGIYTRVDVHLDFIRDVARNNGIQF
jgi:endonuclease G